MKHFSNINSLGELKKQYRDLAKINHPDLGGNTKIMQEINDEFASLFEIWKDRKEVANNGYDTDYDGASAEQYSQYVYDEYKWTGSRYDGKLYGNDLAKIFRQWCKDTYPNCKFSVRQGTGGWTKSFYINLYEADFHPFKDLNKTHSDINHYHLNESHDELTDRAIEVMSNVIKFVQSYNYDNSNIMADYFDVNFYVTFEIGSYSKHFKYKPIAIKSDKPIAREKIGATQRTINAAMKGCKWCDKTSYSDKNILCIDDDSNCPYALYSNNDNLIPNKVKKLNEIGIMCHKEKRLIIFDGYSKDLQEKLDKEKEENESINHTKKDVKMNNDTRVGTILFSNGKKAREGYAKYRIGDEVKEEEKNIQIIDYSEKAIAIIGDTKSIKDILKELGGRFNYRLKCGAGWIFPKSKEEEIKLKLSIV